MIKHLQNLPSNHFRVHSSAAFSTSMMLYKHHRLVLEYWYPFPKKNRRQWFLLFLSMQPLATTDLISVSLNLPVMDPYNVWPFVSGSFYLASGFPYSSAL